MRGFKRVLAASAVALAAFSLTGATNAAAGPVSAQAGCATSTDGHLYAWAICGGTGEYRIAVDYCRVRCVKEVGPWVRSGVSRVDFPPGGSIIDERPEFR